MKNQLCNYHSLFPIPPPFMLPLEEVRRLLERPDLTDAQVEEARDLLTTLANMLIADYLAEKEVRGNDGDPSRNRTTGEQK